MKHAAQVSYVLEKGVDYIVETNEIPVEKESEENQGVIDAGFEKAKELFKKKEMKEVRQVTIIDPNTGYKKPGNRWENYLHEMVEIKEGIPIKQASIAYCSIPQCLFFNMYSSVCGVTGTMGDRNDKQLLKEEYKVNVFKVPRNIAQQKIIYERERVSDEY